MALMINPKSGKQFDIPDNMVEEATNDGLVISTPDKPEISGLKSFGKGSLQGITFGGGDELGGIVRGGLEAFSPSDPNDKRGIVDRFTGGYTEGRDWQREEDKAAQEANPEAYLGGQIAGGVVGTIALPLGKVAGATAYGAGSGFLGSEGSAENQIKDTLKGAALGVGGHYAGEALTKGGDVVKTGWNKLTDTLGFPALKQQEIKHLEKLKGTLNTRVRNVPSGGAEEQRIIDRLSSIKQEIGQLDEMSNVNYKLDRVFKAKGEAKPIKDYNTMNTGFKPPKTALEGVNRGTKQGFEELISTGNPYGFSLGAVGGALAGGPAGAIAGAIGGKVIPKTFGGAFAAGAERNAQRIAKPVITPVITPSAKPIIQKAIERGQPFSSIVNMLNQTDLEFREANINKEEEEE